MNRRELLKNSAWIFGGALTASATTAFLTGCNTTGAGRELDWTPEFLSPRQGATVRELCERILPATDTPGAKDANVQEFFDLYLKDIYTEVEQQLLTEGLDALEADAQSTHQASFADLEAEQMDELLTEYATVASETPDGQPRHWFSYAKELTLVGFFTSEEGATQVLQYEPVPGGYQECAPLEEIGRQWATT